MDLSFSGNAGKTIGIEEAGINVAGKALKLKAGSTTFSVAAAGNIAGGNLELVSGDSTGNAGSNITFSTPTPGASGKTLRTPDQKMIIQGDGKVGIGTGAPSELLEVNGNVKATAFISTSDARLKSNVQKSTGLESILKLQGVTYNWTESGAADAGLIAQEVEAVFPNAVITDKQTGFKGVKYNYLIAPLIESTKELYEICEENKQFVESMRRDIASIKVSDTQQNQKLKALEEANTKLSKENADLKKRLEAIEKHLGLAK
jgi:hypothetical protein